MQFDGNLLAAGIAVLGFVVWLVRLEVQAKNNTVDLSELMNDVYDHHKDKTIHTDETELDRRFKTMSDDMHEMKDDIKQGFKDVNRRFDTFLNKQ